MCQWVVGLLVGVMSASVSFAQDASVRQRCAEVIRLAEAKGLRVGLCAREGAAQKALAAYRSEEAFVPASNQKLLTIAAALAELGTDYRFETGFALERGVLRVRAGGDPNWITGSSDDPHRHFSAVARALREAGVDSVRDIVVDATRFDGPARPEGWPSDQFHLDYCAPTSGVLLDSACFGLEIRAAAEGQPAQVELVAPFAGYAIDGALTCTKDRRKGGIYHVDDAGAALHLRGNYWTRSGPRVVRGASADPGALFVRALRAALAEAGIRIDPAGPARDLQIDGIRTPLMDAAGRALRDSSNIDAEQILRVLAAERGGDGSYVAAPMVLARALEKLVGELPSSTRLVDGSGLSRLDRVSPCVVVDVLQAMAARPEAGLFAGALAVAGRDGTLARRFRGSPLEGRVRAKTGTLAGASALSGYLAVDARRIVVFSILVDTSGAAKGAPDVRQVQEHIVEALAGDPR